jgi:hypothetical protein
MPKVLTTDSTIDCGHEGTVGTSSAAKLRVDGARVLVETGIAGKTISNCTQTGGPPTPCSAVVAITSGRATKLTAGGQPVMLDTLTGTTNGGPPGALSATAGQSRMTAV